MADRGGGKNVGLHSVSSGSEFMYDFYCELCKDDDKIVEAEGFCVDCGEYLCIGCYNGHRKTRESRHHVLLDKHKMPKDNPLSLDRMNKDISTKCKRHTSKLVEFYCKTHDFLGCSTCFATAHRSCPNVESILEKSNGILDSKEFIDFIRTLNSLNKKSYDIIEKAFAHIAQTKGCYSEVIKEVKLLKDEIIVQLETFEKNMIEEAKALMAEEENKSASISKECSTVKDTIKSMLVDIQSMQSSRRACQMYISMKERAGQVKSIQDNLCSADETLVMKSFRFEPNMKLQDFIKSLPMLGKIPVETPPQGTEHRKQFVKKPVQMTDIDVSSKLLSWECFASGSAVVSDTRLIIADCNNCQVELVDTQSNRLIKVLTVSSAPWDITMIGRNKAAVSVPRSNKIILLDVSDRDRLTVNKEIHVSGKCTGLAYSDEKLLVTYVNPPSLELIDLSGKLVKKIGHGSEWNQQFGCPQYVCFRKAGDLIYVSDSETNKITSLTLDGVIKSVYSDSHLNSPTKVSIDHRGYVYVCGCDSRNIHVLTANLTMIKIILTQADGLCRNVYSISHCQKTNRLYVGMHGNKFKVFQLS